MQEATIVEYTYAELAEEYRVCHKCKAVAEKFGCSAETVRRALIRCGVPYPKRNKRPETKPKATVEELRKIAAEYHATDAKINDLAKKYKRSQTTISKAIKTYSGGLKYSENVSKKITDSQLREAAKVMTCNEIAKKFDMSEERVYRRAKKLGIKLETRWGGGHWRRRAERYGCSEFDESISLHLLISRDNGICQICGKPVNSNDIENGRIGGNYPSLDHIIPLSKGGTHTWGNVQLAHLSCNAKKHNHIVQKGVTA